MGAFIPVLVVVAVGLLAGIMLTIASKVFFVPVDETVAKIREVLPGANCGACGFAGCDDYAVALAADRSLSTALCPPGGPETAVAIAEAMGVEAVVAEPRVAIVKCKGNSEMTEKIMEYQGVETCEAVKNFFGGNWQCEYGCLGFGDCVNVCEYGAIKIFDGVAAINRELCVACGLCEKVCPNHVIMTMEKKKLVYVACNSTAKGAKTRKSCKVGCIGCQKCLKSCKFDAIDMDVNLARVNFDKCKNCGLCVKECPTNAIVNTRVKKAVPAKPVVPKAEAVADKPVAEAPKAEAAASKAPEAVKTEE